MARLDLMAAINAAAAEMQNATVNDNKSAQSAGPVRPKVQPSGAKPRVQPKAGAQPKVEPKAEPKAKPAIDPAEAIKAAAESVRVKPKTASATARVLQVQARRKPQEMPLAQRLRRSLSTSKTCNASTPSPTTSRWPSGYTWRAVQKQSLS